MIDDVEGPRLARYLAGESSPEEAEAIGQWIAADPARQELVASLRQVWEATGRLPATWDVDGAWEQFARARAARQVRPIHAASSVGAPRRRFTVPPASSWARVAAAAVLVAASAGVLWRVVLHSPLAIHAPSPDRVYATARGERAETRLPDGTRVLLGPETKLRVPLDYGTTARTVSLQGQAYFEVVHDATRPFEVRSRNAVALDLGTRFGVRAYAEDPQVQVVVAEGKVSLRTSGARPDSGSVLTRGELGRLDVSGTSLVIRGVDLDQYLGWTQGQLVFRGTPLKEAVAEIGRWRDIDVRLASPELGEKRLDASFRDESAAEVLRIVAAALDLKVIRQDRVYTLAPK